MRRRRSACAICSRTCTVRCTPGAAPLVRLAGDARVGAARPERARRRRHRAGHGVAGVALARARDARRRRRGSRPARRSWSGTRRRRATTRCSSCGRVVAAALAARAARAAAAPAGALRVLGALAAGAAHQPVVRAPAAAARCGCGSRGEPARAARRRRRRSAAAVALLALIALPWLPAIAGTWDWSRLAPAARRRRPARPRCAARPRSTSPRCRSRCTRSRWATRSAPRCASCARRPRRRAAARHVAGARRGRDRVRRACACSGCWRSRAGGQLADTRPVARRADAAGELLCGHNFKVFHPRYLAVAMPCLLLAVAAAFADLRPGVRGCWAAAVAALWAVSLSHHYFVPEYGREDYRGAHGRRSRADSLPASRCSRSARWTRCSTTTAGACRSCACGWDSRPVPDRMRERFQQAIAPARGTWVVLSRTEDLDPGNRFARWLDPRYPGCERRSFAGVRRVARRSRILETLRGGPSPSGRPLIRRVGHEAAHSRAGGSACGSWSSAWDTSARCVRRASRAAGTTVVGVDTSAFKVDCIERGESPIVEKDLGRADCRAAATPGA